MKICNCPLCKRDAPQSRHHLTPRSKDKKKRYKEPNSIAGLCIDCHTKVHSAFTNQELAKNYSTIELLREAPGIQEWITFISKKPITQRFSSRASNSR